MQPWTPSRHVRAINAWPTLATASLPHRPPQLPSLHHHKRTLHGNPRRLPRHDPYANSSLRNRPSLSSSDTTHKSLDLDLPTPPFLTREERRLRETEERRSKSVPPDIFVPRNDNKHTKSKQRKRAPFSFAFAENPYAHALATPVREDRFSGARVPNSCLINLHLAENLKEAKERAAAEAAEAAGEVVEVDKRPATESGRKKGDPRPSVSLLPLSMAAELIPKAKRVLTTEEEAIAAAADEDRLPGAPSGSASYIMARKEALDWVTDKKDRRVKAMVVGRRTLQNVGNTLQMEWRDDMPDLILDALRRVVVKKLRYFVSAKENVEKHGASFGYRKYDQLQLDYHDDVLCLMRLKPLPVGEEVQRGSSPGKAPFAPDVEEVSPQPELDDATPTLEAESSSTAEDDVVSDASELGAAAPTPPQEAQSGSSLIDGENPIVAELRAEANELSTPPPQAPKPSFPNKAQRRRLRDGHWTAREPPYLWDIRIPAPPQHPSATYYPTVPYRNRRIAAYHMPYLLGEEHLETLLKETAFEDMEILCLTANAGTVGVQVWLLKLVGYLAGPKGAMPRI